MKVVALVSGLMVEVEVGLILLVLVLGFIVKLVFKQVISGWTVERELMIVSSGLIGVLKFGPV